MKIDRFTISDTARQSDGEDFTYTQVTDLTYVQSGGVDYRTKGEGANPQEEIPVMTVTRGASDTLAMESLKGR
jgi:hypothetical protein